MSVTEVAAGGRAKAWQEAIDTMAETSERGPRPRRPRLPRISDLVEAGDDMIAFVEKYQKVWESESKAMIGLGEFLGARAESMRYQVELMRMGTDTFRRYLLWSESLLSLRPDTFLQSFLRPRDVESEAGTDAE